MLHQPECHPIGRHWSHRASHALTQGLQNAPRRPARLRPVAAGAQAAERSVSKGPVRPPSAHRSARQARGPRGRTRGLHVSRCARHASATALTNDLFRGLAASRGVIALGTHEPPTGANPGRVLGHERDHYLAAMADDSLGDQAVTRLPSSVPGRAGLCEEKGLKQG